MSKVFSVAIDGPVGAGKSCVAKKVAERLNAAYLDTGAMYRAVGLYMLENGVSLEDGAAIAENAGKARVDVRYEGREQRTYLNGRDVTGELRRPEVSLASSAVAKVHAVREALVNRQRELARGISLVMDGRDIGTCVLTDATLKIFLTAAPEERARPRFQMNGRVVQSFEDVLNDLIRRDRNDMSRAESPLRCAEDAVELDSTSLTEDEVVERIVSLLMERTGGERA